jgi:hypothetical protein
MLRRGDRGILRMPVRTQWRASVGVGVTPFQTDADATIRLAVGAEKLGYARFGSAEGWTHDAVVLLAQIAAPRRSSSASASSPPKGVLTDGEGRARRFSGWIELAAAIEDWRTASSRPDPDRVRDEARASRVARPSQHRRLATDPGGGARVSPGLTPAPIRAGRAAAAGRAARQESASKTRPQIEEPNASNGVPVAIQLATA